MSLSYWVYIVDSVVSDYCHIFTAGISSSFIASTFIQTYVYFRFIFPNADFYATGVVVNTWNHILFLRKSGACSVFVNNSLIKTVAYTNLLDLNEFTVAGPLRMHDSILPNFNGNLDEFAIWNRALTENEIDKLYNNGAGRKLL
jgi:hypothetical protein